MCKRRALNFKNLIPYFETVLCGNYKSYKNHGDPKDLSRVIALASYENGRKLAYMKGLPLFRGKFEGL